VTTPITASAQHICADIGELDALQTACAGGATTASCTAAFAVLQATHATCAACVKPFNVDFQDYSGIFRCVAPFVSTACNRSTGCDIDCATTACTGCTAANVEQCHQDVQNTGGECDPFLLQAVCVNSVLGPGQPGRFCNPVLYGGNFGSWLRAVGRHFCGDGT
jgi:hypothetical protein